MEVQLDFVPPGGGTVEYSLIVEVPALPRVGDHISIQRPPHETDLFAGTIDFFVLSVRWNLEYPDNETFEDPENPTVGITRAVALECEFALASTSSGSHKAACQRFHHMGKTVRKINEQAP